MVRTVVLGVCVLSSSLMLAGLHWLEIRYCNFLSFWKLDRLYPKDFRYWLQWKDCSISWCLSSIDIFNCDCEVLTSAIWWGFHWYTMRCEIHHFCKWRTTSLRLRPTLWSMSRVLPKNQVFFWLLVLLLVSLLIKIVFSLWSKILVCLLCTVFSSNFSQEQHLTRGFFREQNEDKSLWSDGVR